MKTILSGIPEWIKSIHVIYLDSNFKRIKIVKVFSKYLNNHIPIKSRIDLSIPINVNFLGLTEKILIISLTVSLFREGGLLMILKKLS